MKTRFLLPYALISSAGIIAPASAQNILYAEYGQQMLPVRTVRQSRAMVEIGGKLVPATGGNFALKATDEYFPVLIMVRTWDISGEYSAISGTSDRINSRFRLEADFESSYQLEDVFIALSFRLQNQTSGLFIYEVGRLDAYIPRHLSRTVPMTSMLSDGQYEFHLFAGGREVFHSRLSESYRSEMLDKMVSRRVAGVQSASVKRFVGPEPKYPEKLARAKIVGNASVRFRIGINGTVLNPEITEASDPAFGEAALNAIRESRFLPKIENGRPVESSVKIPFEFKPPPKP